MSQSGRGFKGKRRNNGTEIGLWQVVIFLRLIAAMGGALLVLSLVFFLILPRTQAGSVVLLVTAAVDLAVAAGSLAGAVLIDRKDKELERKEQERRKKDGTGAAPE